jgi:hypothetical protein
MSLQSSFNVSTNQSSPNYNPNDEKFWREDINPQESLNSSPSPFIRMYSDSQNERSTCLYKNQSKEGEFCASYLKDNNFLSSALKNLTESLMLVNENMGSLNSSPSPFIKMYSDSQNEYSTYLCKNQSKEGEFCASYLKDNNVLSLALNNLTEFLVLENENIPPSANESSFVRV